MDTGSFPTVGDSVLAYVGKGAASRPKRGRLEAKQTMGRGSSPTGTVGKRSNYKIKEANGPKCHVVSKLYAANAADAGLQTRNVKIVHSAAGVTDFQKARSAAGSVY